MIDCFNVARYFIVRAYEDRIEAEMTNMKVQKLLYYAQSLHLALYDEPLFGEEIQAWRYGPVCPPAYRTHLRSIQEGNRIWLNYELSYKFYRLIVRIFFLLFLSLNTTVL